MKHYLLLGWELHIPSENLVVLSDDSGYVGVTFKQKVFGNAELLLLQLKEGEVKVLSTPQFVDEVEISVDKVIKIKLSDFAEQFEAQ